MSKTSILDQEENVLGSDPSVLLANFFTNLGKNGGKVFEIKAIPISDKEKKVKISTLKAYFVNEIQVVSFDVTKKQGYVEINHDLDMPLVKLKLSNGPWYDYDKENAIAKVKDLNRTERELIDEQVEQYALAQDYMRRVDEGMYF